MIVLREVDDVSWEKFYFRSKTHNTDWMSYSGPKQLLNCNISVKRGYCSEENKDILNK